MTAWRCIYCGVCRNEPTGSEDKAEIDRFCAATIGIAGEFSEMPLVGCRGMKRVDNVYGNRHLDCTSAPLESYVEAAE